MSDSHDIAQPRFPRVRGLDYYGATHNQRERGRDFLDFVALTHSTLLFLLGEVATADISGGVLMAGTRALLHALAMIIPLRFVIQDLNRTLCDVFAGRCRGPRKGAALLLRLAGC